MSRLHKISILVFCLGVLLCGIGSGLLVTELDGFVYGGKYILGDPEMRTDEIDVKFEPGEERLMICGVSGSCNRGSARIEVDGSVPEDTARFCMTYNAKRVEPFAQWIEQSEVEMGRIDFGWYWKGAEDEMALMMEMKDVVLQNLKEGKLVSCGVKDVEEVTVRINPANEEDVRILY